MRNVAIIDEIFDINITSSYHLCLQISSDGIAFAVLDTVRMKFVAFKNILFGEILDDDELFQKLDILLNTEGYLNRNYRLLSLYFASPNATLIPAPIYDSSRKAQFEEFLGSSRENHTIIEKYIKGIDAFLIFSMPYKLHQLALNQLDTPNFFHQSIPMIENAMVAAKGLAGSNRVYAQIYPGLMDIVVIQDGKMLLYNSFVYKTVKDLVFYILYLYDQFQLPTQHTTLEIAGNTDERSELVVMLKKYIREIVFQEFNRSFSYSYTFNELEQHHFSNLINLFRCE